MALLISTFGQVTINGNTTVEHKTLAMPSVFFVLNLFEIRKNPALQLIDLREAELHHQRSRFLTTNSAGTKHRKRPLPVLAGELFRVLREITKTMCLRVNGVFECTHLEFVMIAGINNQYVWILNQLIPLRWADVLTGRFVRLDVGAA